MTNMLKFILGILIIAYSQSSLGSSPHQGHAVFQAGASFNTSGKAQNIYIQNMLGDRFTVTQNDSQSYLLGVAYLIEGVVKANYQLDYGINALYLGDSTVKGTVTEEFLYNNLAYQYRIQHVPIYAEAKATLTNLGGQFSPTLDVGIGPSINNTSKFKEWPINDSNAFPDPPFLGKTNVTFSAMVGAGIKINHVYKDTSLEIGYRFFYLGNSAFDKPNQQWLNTLKTGASYTQSILCSVIF